jgi:hypothetical protein
MRDFVSKIYDLSSTGDKIMVKIIKTSRGKLSRLFAVFGQRQPYRWYEVEVALF